MKKLYALAPLALLLVLFGCSGGNKPEAVTPPKPALATTLAYTDPATGAYLLKQNTALSTPAGHLVLELWGPATVSGSGVTATLTLDTAKAAWANVSASDAAGTYIANGTVFGLGTGTPILKAKVTGGTLVATVAEKGVTAPKALNGPLLRFGVTLNTGAALTTGAAISLAADAVKCQVLLGDGSLPAITVATGVLSAK